MFMFYWDELIYRAVKPEKCHEKSPKEFSKGKILLENSFFNTTIPLL
jgi:hypothetical protein